MKQIDFSKTGGLPFTQDRLAFLQTAYTEALQGLAALGGNGPYIISGMAPGSVGGFSGILSGWLYYNGELLQFTASSIPPLSGANVLMIKIQEATSPLTYGNNTVYNVQKARTAYLTQGPSAQDATQFPYSLLVPMVRESSFSTIAASSFGGTSGTVYYRKNNLANTLQIKGVMTAATAQSLNATGVYTGSNLPSGPPYYNMCQLPVGYRPGTTTPFVALVRYHNSLFLDDLGNAYLKSINCELEANGNLNTGWIKPSGGIAAYSVSFNVVIPLD